jgi:hypothetical protein
VSAHSERLPILRSAAFFLTLASCVNEPATSSAHVASPPPRASEPMIESQSAVPITISRSGKYLVSCPATGTALAIPNAWQSRLERLSDSEVMIDCRECGGVLKVTSTERELGPQQILATLGELHERLTAQTLIDATISEISFNSGHTELHYNAGTSLGEEGGGAYVLSGFVVGRDRATCEILVVETERAWLSRRALSPLLHGIQDSPWRDVREPAEPRPGGEDLLRAMLTVGAYAIMAAPH